MHLLTLLGRLSARYRSVFMGTCDHSSWSAFVRSGNSHLTVKEPIPAEKSDPLVDPSNRHLKKICDALFDAVRQVDCVSLCACLTLQPPAAVCGLSLQSSPLQVGGGTGQRQRGNIMKLQFVPVRLIIEQSWLHFYQDLVRRQENKHMENLQRTLRKYRVCGKDIERTHRELGANTCTCFKIFSVRLILEPQRGAFWPLGILKFC